MQQPSAPATPGDTRTRDRLRREGVALLRLQFCDLAGSVRSVTAPAEHLEPALQGGLAIDGSALDGGGVGEGLELLLRPDPTTLLTHPDLAGGGRVARVVCDVVRPDGGAYEGDPRGVLRRAVAEMEEAGFEPEVGFQVEFYLVPTSGPGFGAPARTDLRYADTSVDRTVAVAQAAILRLLADAGIGVRSATPGASPGKLEVVLEPAPALAAADRLALVRALVREVAAERGLRAVFMPQPGTGWSGVALHTRHTLRGAGGNAFSDPESSTGLSETLAHFVGGLLVHARGYCAVTNPLVNSYKRLAAGTGAPNCVAWSLHARSGLVRVPAGRGDETRCEVRLPDGAANPYLALAVQLAAGLDGVRQERAAGDPLTKSVEQLTQRERQRLRISPLPRHLGEALDELEQDRVVRGVLGEHIFSRFVEAKRREWDEYLAHVHPWEVDRYL